MASTQPTSFVLSPTAKAAIKLLCSELGLNRSNVLELAVRTLARKHGIRLAKIRWFPKKPNVRKHR